MPREIIFNKDEVVEKAKNLFWLKGYNATSMQDLVEATGLNRSSIYNSFGSKMQMYQLALDKYQKEAIDFFDVITYANINGFDSIKKVFDATLNIMHSDFNRRGCMFVNCNTEMSNQDMQLKNITEKNQDLLIHFFQKLVIKGHTDGSIPENKKSENIALYLTSALQGFRITGMNTVNKNALNSIVENILNNLK